MSLNALISAPNFEISMHCIPLHAGGYSASIQGRRTGPVHSLLVYPRYQQVYQEEYLEYLLEYLEYQWNTWNTWNTTE